VVKVIPWNVSRTAQIVATGDALFLPDLRKIPAWAGDPKWAETNTPSFAGQPLVFRGEILGALAMWCSAPISERALSWLRLFADQAAVAIANARGTVPGEKARNRLVKVLLDRLMNFVSFMQDRLHVQCRATHL
jgi:GAF domain-containing protein